MTLLDQINATPTIESQDIKQVQKPKSLLERVNTTAVIDPNRTNLTATIAPTDYKSQYDTGLTPMINDVEKFRAGKQSVTSQFANALFGGIGSGAVGILENFSVLGDAVGNKLGLMEDWEKSALTENLQGAKDYINELTPLYRKERSDTFDWDDSGFYFEMLKGAVDSAVAFGVAGAGYAGLMGKLASTLGKATLAGQRLNVLARFYGSKIGAPTIAQELTQLGAAALSNYSEGTIMGLETYETEKEKLMDVGMRNKAQQVALEKGIDISEVVLSPDELEEVEGYAIQEAGKAGNMMRNLNHMLIFSNMAQMNSIFGLKKFIGAGGSTASRNMVKKAGTKEFLKGQLIGAPLEGSEEILQNVIQMESKYQSDLSAQASGLKFRPDELESTNTNLGGRLVEFATSDQALLEGMMGFISGPIQYGLTQAPFQQGQKAEQLKRYATQQILVGRNAEFIKSKLAQTATGETLAGEFEAYRDEVLGRDPSTDTAELKAEDSKRFEALIANTQLDTLIQENFFNGTTQDLEDQLTEAAGKQGSEEEISTAENATKALERLNLLENRFTNYNKYINGAEIFAADLRGERLGEISKQLEESFTNRESQMTKDIQASIENEYVKLYGDKFDGELTNLSKNFILKSVDKDGKPIDDSNKEVNSVAEIIQGIRNGYELFQSETGGKVLADLDVVNKALMNQALLDNTKALERSNRLFVNEAKTKTYQSMYADFTDAMQSVDENDVNDMGTVKGNLETLLTDPRYAYKKGDTAIYNNEDFFTIQKVLKNGNVIIQKDGKTIEINADETSNLLSGKYKQLKQSIQLQIADLDKKINFIEAKENSLEEDAKNDVKTQSAEAAKTKKKEPTAEAPLEPIPWSPPGAAPAVVAPVAEAGKTKTWKAYPKEITDQLKLPLEQREEKFQTTKFINPETSQAEPIHTLRDTDTGTEVSFPSNPTKFHKFTTEDGVDAERFIPQQKEVYTDKKEQAEIIASTPSTTYKKGDKISYQGQPGYTVQEVMPNGKIKIKRNNRTIEINPNKLENTITPDTGTSKKATTKVSESKTPNNQIDNKKDTKQVPNNKKNVNLENIEPAAVDSKASTDSMKKSIQQQDTLETPNEVDVIAVIDPVNKETKYESANVKALDYNFSEANDDKYAEFVRNKHNKESVPILMSVDTSNDGLVLFKYKKKQVEEAIAIFNKLKQSGLKNLKNWNTVITDQEYDTLIKFLPVKFNVKSNPKIQSHIQVEGKFALKAAEKILREDTINAALQGKSLERKLKGQGPGALNEQQPEKLSTFLTDDSKVNNAILHVSIGGALVALDEINDDLFDSVFMGYTTADGQTEGWDGVFTIGVKNLAGEMFPVKLNTLNHSRESADIVASLLVDMVNKAYITQKGDLENNVQKAKLQDINPNAYEWFENNMPSIFKVYGDNITVGQALSDLVYYGNKTKDSFGHLSVANGVVSFGGAVNPNYRNANNTPLQFSYDDLQDGELRNRLAEFIEQVKPYNVQASKLKGSPGVDRTAYKKHVFSNYMESSVNLDTPFTKVTSANPNGDPVQRYQRAHLYISALAPTVEAEQGVITPVDKAQVFKVNTTSNIKPSVKAEIKKETVNLQEEKDTKNMQEKTEEELNKCNLGGKAAPKKKASLKNALNKNRKK
tara:strand:+ start:13724 stop:18649 length:4926 start_codon:yes stop_codon:yes gene_type:complete